MEEGAGRALVLEPHGAHVPHRLLKLRAQLLLCRGMVRLRGLRVHVLGLLHGGHCGEELCGVHHLRGSFWADVRGQGHSLVILEGRWGIPL